MIWNSSFYLLGFDEKSVVLFDGSIHKIYSHPVQYTVLLKFFGREEVTLDRLRELYKDTYSLHEILEAFYGFVQDKVLVPESFFKIAVESPEEPSLTNGISKFGFGKIHLDTQQPELTVFIVSDIGCLQHTDLLKIKSKQFIIIWIFGNELKVFPVFDKTDTAFYFSFLNRIKRAFYSQILSSTNHCLSLNKAVTEASLGIVLDYLPEYISSGEAQNLLLIFDRKKLDIKRIPIHKSLLNPTPNVPYDILNEQNEPADIYSVFRRLSFHLEKPLGLVDQLKSEQTPSGGWVSSGGVVYRSNKVSTEQFFSRNRASGNGLTKGESEAKAFCETLERYSQVFREYEDEYIIDTYKNLEQEAIHPNELLLYSPDQYRENKAHNQTGTPLIPFDEKKTISWSYVNDLFCSTGRWIPTFLLYLGIPPEDTSSEKFFKWITNGTAAGSTHEMARLHALYELIERDAYAIWWYNRLNARGIDIRCICHLKTVAPALEEHQRLGKNVYVFDITQDILIPTVAVISDLLPDTYIMACGTNVSFEKACEKAFSELNQLYLFHSVKKTRLNAFQLTDTAATLNLHKPLQPIWDSERSPLTISAELKIAETEIRKKELTIYYKDLSRCDVLLPVVKAIVPGMRDLDTRFAAGRLYSVVHDLYGYLPTENSLRNFNLY